MWLCAPQSILSIVPRTPIWVSVPPPLPLTSPNYRKRQPEGSTLGTEARYLTQFFRKGYILSRAFTPLQSVTDMPSELLTSDVLNLAETKPIPSTAQPAPSEVWCPLTFHRGGQRLALQHDPNRADFPGYVLRISHPLDVFRHPPPTRLISSWIRLWGLPFEVFHQTTSRTSFRMPQPS
jgi:hypothetical protein